MKTLSVFLITLFSLFAASTQAAAPAWKEGTHYTLSDSVNRQTVAPGQTLITEVFSYACPACNAFAPTMRKLREAMPKAQFEYVPAGFIAAEDWPMFQRAFCTAQVLHIAEKTHDAMFKAVWTTGELATMDPASSRLKKPLPSLEEAAKFYQREAGVKAADFVAAANSFSVDLKIKAADEFIRNYKVTSTPTLIINGKYITDVHMAGGYDQLIDLIKFLSTKDRG